MNKEEFYKRFKIVGVLSYIPTILVAGPMAGYFIGDYLEKRFRLPSYVLLICIGVGFISSAAEVIRIIRLVLKFDRNP